MYAHRSYASSLYCITGLLLLFFIFLAASAAAAPAYAPPGTVSRADAEGMPIPNPADPLRQKMELPPVRHGMMGAMTHGEKPHTYSDNSYLSAMIAHHEAALAMSREVLEKGRDERARAWAGDIIKAQEKEIATMRGWLGSVGGEDSEAARGMRRMMEKMRDRPLSQDADENFVRMMIEHHEGAVEMAVEAVVRSENQDIVELSRDIVEDQLEEIVAFKAWLHERRQER